MKLYNYRAFSYSYEAVRHMDETALCALDAVRYGGVHPFPARCTIDEAGDWFRQRMMQQYPGFNIVYDEIELIA